LFDINANGTKTGMQWVAPEGNEAFLVRDLNGNGKIDDGSELFGVGTEVIEQQASAKGTKYNHLKQLSQAQRATNGFVALSQYDLSALGGNNDGFISVDDEVWSTLFLWLDSNADGLSSDGEFILLEDVGITHLNTIPKSNNRRDPAGNWMPLWSWVNNRNINGNNRYKMVDVFFNGL
jgi:hypothetical protein